MEDAVVDATCTEPEKVGEVCSVCGYATELTPVGEPNGHNYEWEVIEAGCLAGEAVKYTCSVCGDTYTENTGDGTGLGHTWGEGVVTEPTCTEAGYTTKTCTACGVTETYDETAALGHDHKENVVAPTCGAEGYTEMICSVCGDKYVAEGSETAKNPEAHNFVVDKIIREATCEKAGIAKMACSICGASGGYKTLSVEHSWNDGEITTEPTCTEAGVITFTCACGATKEGAVEATGHSYTEEVTDPTCGKAGNEHSLDTVLCHDRHKHR
jgi:hypothetical protein